MIPFFLISDPDMIQVIFDFMSVALAGTTDSGVESDMAIVVTPSCNDPAHWRANCSIRI